MVEKHISTVSFVRPFLKYERSSLGKMLSIHQRLCGLIAVDQLDICLFYLGVVKVGVIGQMAVFDASKTYFHRELRSAVFEV